MIPDKAFLSMSGQRSSVCSVVFAQRSLHKPLRESPINCMDLVCDGNQGLALSMHVASVCKITNDSWHSGVTS